MIRNFAEHSANERTYLAWVRTGIAVTAFGFVLEKFNLFNTRAGRERPGGSGKVYRDRPAQRTGWPL